MKVAFEVPGAPVAKAKKVGTRAGHGCSYNDPKTDAFQNLVCMCARTARPIAPVSGPLALDVIAVYPRPAYMSKRAKRTGELLGGYSEGRIPKDLKPDFDNLAKSICDGVNASGLWGDDGQVYDGRVRKFWAATNEQAHVEVEIRWED